MSRSDRFPTVRQGGCRHALVLFLLLTLLPAAPCRGEARNFREVEAAFLRNFAHYVNWPPYAFLDEQSPWCIGILGPDPFGDILEATFKDRSENGRGFALYRAASPEQLPPCQIVFINYDSADQRRMALDKLKGRPVLTVGDAAEFMREGGVIQLRVGDTVGIGINLDRARDSALTIQTKMLEVASDILEGGEFRRIR
ncbi:YfiR family protein [Methylomonas sp. SURF-2]|uniref:YfiR family protein n=1 Tax=Methylomonas subterranea TaxID=2952225 RepID=A0ABT1TLR8_9GAMM|nr:YfiR family protein [Methylomonas sp. SURF-2]